MYSKIKYFVFYVLMDDGIVTFGKKYDDFFLRDVDSEIYKPFNLPFC